MNGNQEHKRKTGALKYKGVKARSANAKLQNLRPKKERRSASKKGSAWELEGLKKACAQLW
jgi:hypothetical protein